MTGAARPTLYEYAGGRAALVRLAEAQYRRCLTDPVLTEIFGTAARPGHVEHLADWLTEVLGGPRLYTERHGGHGALLGHHANLQIHEHHRARFVEVFIEAADEVGLPANAVFRRRLLEYLQWGSKIARDVSQPGADTSSDQAVPVWGWGPEEEGEPSLGSANPAEATGGSTRERAGMPLSPPRDALSDGVIALRLRIASDFEAISEGRRDPLALRWLADPPLENDTPEAGVGRAAKQWESGRSAPFVISDATTDRPLGLINLRFDGDDALVAYSVLAAARGRGVAPRAVRLLAAWAFEDLGLSELLLEADRRNTASLRVAEKCGFRWLRDRAEVDDTGETTTMAVFRLLRG